MELTKAKPSQVKTTTTTKITTSNRHRFVKKGGIRTKHRNKGQLKKIHFPIMMDLAKKNDAHDLSLTNKCCFCFVFI